MDYNNVNAVIVKEAVYKEKDRLYTVVTDRLGKINVSARGVLSINSKLSGGISKNAVSELEIKESNNGIFILTSAKKVITFDNLIADLEAASYVNYISSLAGDLFLPGDPYPALFKLLVNTIYLFDSKKKDYELLKAIFELRAMAISGYAMEFDGCGACGEKNITHISLEEGMGLCSECAKFTRSVPVSKDVVSAISHIMFCEDKNVFSFRLGESLTKELSDISEKYVKLCMEKEYSSLAYLRKIQKGL